MKLKELTCINENINLDEYLAFRSIVHQSMEHPDWLRALSKEQLDNILKTGSKIWIYYNNNEPVCSMMIIKETKQELTELKLDVRENEAINYGAMFVNPKYYGNKLQLQMLEELDNYVKQLGYKYAFGTIHPDNYYSINNVLKDNFRCLGMLQLERGLRNIYLKDLTI